MRTLQLRMAPTLQSRPIMLSSGVLAEASVLRKIIFFDIGLLGCLTALPPAETIADSSSGQQLGISTFFSIAQHPPLPPSYLVFSLSVLFHPSIFLPTHPPTHSSIHTSTHHPSIHPFIQERMRR